MLTADRPLFIGESQSCLVREHTSRSASRDGSTLIGFATRVPVAAAKRGVFGDHRSVALRRG